MHTIQENAEALVVASKETGLQVNADKTKYMVMCRDQNAGRSHSVKNDNNSFERVEEFICLGTTLTDQNSIQEEIKSRLKSWNACYHSLQNTLSSSVLPKNLKIKVHKTIILPLLLYGSETWSLILREERRLRVFEDRMLRRIFGLKRDEITGEWRKLHYEELIVRVIKPRRKRWAGYVGRMGERRGVCRGLGGET